MIARSPAVLLALLVVSSPLVAQHQHGHSPYAGQEEREIKALSPERVQGLLEGAGLGLAKSAELNGLPGPKHVLELADRLDLGPEQRRRVEAVEDEMRRDAVELGRRIVHAERELDRRFASGEITAGEVDEATAAIARLEGRLRAVHLKAHLATTSLLTERQVGRYARLRGYTDLAEGER